MISQGLEFSSTLWVIIENTNTNNNKKKNTNNNNNNHNNYKS